MQEYEDIYLRCCQCGEGFHSAAFLLLHYSFHISRLKHEQDSDESSTRFDQTFQPEVESFQDENNSLTNTISALDPKSESDDSLMDNSQNVLTNEDQKHPEDLCTSDFTKCNRNVRNVSLTDCDGIAKESDIDNKGAFLCENNVIPPNLKLVENTTFGSGRKKRYSCHLCPKIFGWSTDLKRHILVHTGERPFKCASCSASFTRNFLLQKHSLKVHNLQNSERLQREVIENMKKLKASFYELDKNKSPNNTTDNAETNDNMSMNVLDNNDTVYTKLLKSSQPKKTSMEILSLII